MQTFKLSNDPRFDEKFRDRIGLPLDPPGRALVLRCDPTNERTQLDLFWSGSSPI